MSPHLQRASLLMQHGRTIDAETELRAALAAGEESAIIHAMLALCLRSAGLHGEANSEVNLALALDPNCAYAHYVLSFPSAPTGQKQAPVFLGSCLKHIMRALEIEPNNVGYLARLAELRQQLHQWKESLEPLAAALRLSPHNVGLAVQYAEALIHLGRRDEARATLLSALQSDPAAAAAHAGMGWTLLRAGDLPRATEFFEEALRLRPELGWAQHGALACAKHQYRLYRLLAWHEQRFIHRPLFRFGIEMGVCVVILFAAFATLFWLDPIIRPRWGPWPIIAIFLPLAALPFALMFGREPLFLWLVRHHRAAQLSHTEPIVKENAAKWLLGIIVGAATIFFTILLDHSKSPLAFGLLGLVPGISALGVSLCDVPRDPWRKWLVAFSAGLLVAGPIALVAGREFILELDPDPRSCILLCVPAIFIAIISNRIKQRHRIQRHKQTLEANRRKF